MNLEGPVRDRRRAGFGWIVELCALLSSHRSVVAAGRCGAVNAFIGFLLIGLAVLIGTGDVPGGSVQSLTMGVLGATMLMGTVAMGIWPVAAFAILTWQGALFVVVTGIFTIDSFRWLFQPSPAKSFRYLPGMFLAPWSLGWAEIGAFGPWPRHARALRRTGMWIGLVCEILFVIGVLLRIAHRLP
jgi:hypothetical protein